VTEWKRDEIQLFRRPLTLTITEKRLVHTPTALFPQLPVFFLRLLTSFVPLPFSAFTFRIFFDFRSRFSPLSILTSRLHSKACTLASRRSSANTLVIEAYKSAALAPFLIFTEVPGGPRSTDLPWYGF
jgi:hypothetical protein